MNHSNLSAITFDIGGTLIECQPSVGHLYAQVAARHGFDQLDPALLNRQFATAWRTLKDFHHTRAQWAALVDATFRGLVPVLPSQTFFPDLYDRFCAPDAWHVFPDVRPTLQALAGRGFKLGVISNWDERLRPLLRALGLQDYFQTIVVSCEVGVPKPSPLIFQHAARQLDLPPEAILHIGDSPAHDVAGARAAGCQALQLARPVAAEPGRIGSLRELLSWPRLAP
ncbi:MAG TPA: HAD-IA family hydrolase [Candidatus Sulfotelmatobacter sp.]|nr:HAD-IA family hydrolase [Candidatus Sulfotelmatobacter sp.]HWI58456.1 HAD-IA family hydrolase [Bacillota bacterium]